MIRILTDSTSDISPARAAELGVEILPLTVLFGEESFQDGVEITNEAFYARLEKADALPTTAQIPPETFIQTFERLTKSGDQVLAILISSAMSGTYQSAMIARGIVDESKIAVVDARTVTFGMGLLVEAACQLRDQELSLLNQGAGGGAGRPGAAAGRGGHPQVSENGRTHLGSHRRGGRPSGDQPHHYH